MKPANFLRDTVDLVKQIETRFLELGARLYKIREEKLYLDMYTTYNEFLDAAHLNPGYASMLAKIHKTYVLEGAKQPEELAGIGYSNLYEAIPLIEKDGFETALVKASTLTRAEIKEEVREEKHGVHDHEIGGDRFAFCLHCGKLIPIYETNEA